MKTQASMRPASYDEILANPLFKRGYHQVWDGQENAIDARWSDDEQLAYERGRHFAWVLKREGEEKCPLSRGYLAHPRAKLLLMMAMIDEDVL